jgi:flagellar protein FlaF
LLFPRRVPEPPVQANRAFRLPPPGADCSRTNDPPHPERGPLQEVFTVYHKPLQAYQSVDQATLPGRATEAAVLNKAAQKLKGCRDRWQGAERDGRLDEALKYNQLLWSIFQGELSRNDNPLPRETRINLLRLSAFIDRRILEVMAYPTPEKLDIIIDINQNIAAGLRDHLTA